MDYLGRNQEGDDKDRCEDLKLRAADHVDLHESLSDYVKGDSREKLTSLIDRPPYFHSLATCLADVMTHHSGESLTSFEELEALINPLQLESAKPEEVEIFRMKLRLFELTRGQAGRDIRRELRLLDKYQDHILPGMIAGECLDYMNQMTPFFNSLIKSDPIALSSIKEPLPSYEILGLIIDPEKFYQRLCNEAQIVCMQSARQDQWIGDGQFDLKNSIYRNPDQVADRIMQSKFEQSLGSHAQYLPQFLRKGNLLGIPEYDLPIELLSQLDENDRVAFRSAVEKRGGKKAQLIIESLDQLEHNLSEGSYSYSLSPIEVISARKAQINEPVNLSKPVDRWHKLLKPTFQRTQKEMGSALLDVLGYIPQELYSLDKFERISFADLARFHNELLRPLEQKSFTGEGGEYGKQRVLHARTQLLHHLFLKGRVEHLKSSDEQQVTLDTNGLRLDIEDKDGKRKAAIHAHIPFAYISDELSQYLLNKGWINDVDLTEIQLQKAKVNNDIFMQEKMEDRKVIAFDLVLDSRKKESYSYETAVEDLTDKESKKPECPSYRHAYCASVVGLNPSYLPQAVLHANAYIPESIVRYYLEHWYDHETWGKDEKYKLLKSISMLEVAESLQSIIANEVEINIGLGSLPAQLHDQVEVSQTYRLAETAKKSYTSRQKILNDARYYNVARLVAMVLEHGSSLASNSENLLTFRGYFGKKGSKQHHFLELLHNGKLVRVLIQPEKHLNKKQREIFEQIPILNRSDYETLEAFNVIYAQFHENMRQLKTVAIPYDWPPSYASSFNGKLRVDEADDEMKKINSILKLEFPEEFPQALRLYRSFVSEKNKLINREGEQEALKNLESCHPFIRAYYDFCETLLEKYSKKLFSSADPLKTVQDLSVEIKRDEISFGPNFLDELPNKKARPWAYDSQLAHCGQSIRVVYAEDSHIPYAMEAKAIRALGIPANRPLINIAGGGRNTGYNDVESPSLHMGREILTVADQYKANIAPPGTQSGFGADIGKLWIEYQAANEHLPKTDKAYCFAISPGGETFYPGNPYLSTDEEADSFAIAPFDSILTKMEAGWSWKGERKALAPYMHHVEYMEAIYQRLAEGQPRVMVIGNGGSFTIVEGIAALKNKVPIILTRNTGRFADLIIHLFEEMPDWEQKIAQFQGDRQQLDQILIDIIQHKIPNEFKSRMIKDFGLEIPAENAEQDLYRQFFYEFLIQANSENLTVSEVNDLSESIEQLIQRQQDN